MKFYTKEWYNSGCSSNAIAKDKQYESYFIDDDLTNSHDAKILSDDVEQLNGNTLELQLDNNNSFCIYNKIVFGNYTIKENAHIKDSWCIAEEFFKLPNGNYEFHLMVEYFDEHHEEGILEYFTVECSKIEFSGENFHLEYKNKKCWKPD